MSRLLSLAFAASLLFAGCADRSKLPPAERGRAAYVSYQCRQCHRIGYDGGDTGPDLTYAGFRKSAEFLDVWLKEPSAWQPETRMPNFHMTDETRADLAAYLATLRGEPYRRDPPWDKPAFAGDPVRRGAELYVRTGCVTCHGREGRGGYRNNNVIGGEVPALEKVREGYSREELERRIAEGVRHPVKADPAGPEPYLWMPAWKDVLEPGEISDLAAYLFSLYPEGEAAEEW